MNLFVDLLVLRLVICRTTLITETRRAIVQYALYSVHAEVRRCNGNTELSIIIQQLFQVLRTVLRTALASSSESNRCTPVFTLLTVRSGPLSAFEMCCIVLGVIPSLHLSEFV